MSLSPLNTITHSGIFAMISLNSFLFFVTIFDSKVQELHPSYQQNFSRLFLI